jgi:hypothetical protein
MGLAQLREAWEGMTAGLTSGMIRSLIKEARKGQFILLTISCLQWQGRHIQVYKGAGKKC